MYIKKNYRQEYVAVQDSVLTNHLCTGLLGKSIVSAFSHKPT